MASQSPRAVRVDGWSLTGRERELDAVLSAHTSDDNGVVLIGGGGIGKTRFAREALNRLTADPDRAEWVTATRAAAAIDFGAVSHLLPADVQLRHSGVGILRQLAGRFRSIAAERGRVVLAVDDAHLLDDASAAFVHHLAVHALAFLIVTVRAGEPTPDAITALWKEDLINRIDLQALPAAVSSHLIDSLFSGWIDAVSRRELTRFGAGNPLLLRELLQGTVEAGSLRRVAGIWRWSGALPVSSRLIEVVDAQIGAVDPAVRTVLEVVACGEPLPVALLERITDDKAVAAAEKRRLVVMESSGSQLVARLAHPLYREVIRATLSATRARAMWALLSDESPCTLIQRWQSLPDARVWPLHVGMTVEPDALLTAARQALARIEHRTAERLARFARTHGGGRSADQLLAEILTHQGRYEEAADVLPGSPPAGGSDEGHEHARWTITRAAIAYWGRSDASEAERILAAARRRDVAEATRCWILLFEGRCAEALRVGGVILRSPGATPEAVVPVSAVVVAAAGLAGHIDQATAVYHGGLTVAARHEHDLPWGRLQLGYAYCLALLSNGRLADAWRLADQEYQAAAAEQSAPVVGAWAAMRGAVAKEQGRVELAARALQEAVALLEGYDTCRLARLCLAELAGAAALAGDPVEAMAWLRRADQHKESAGRLFEPWVELNRAWTVAANGDTLRAAAHARNAAELACATGQPTQEATALYAVARLGDARAARGRLASLADQLDSPFITHMAEAAAALADHQAVPLERMAGAFYELGLPLYAVETAMAAAGMHLRAGRHTRASCCLERAGKLRTECAQARTPLLDSTSMAATLTRREREVALLAAANRSSREIAARLGLSVRTVDNYLGRAYGKLGVSGRGELARLLGSPS